MSANLQKVCGPFRPKWVQCSRESWNRERGQAGFFVSQLYTANFWFKMHLNSGERAGYHSVDKVTIHLFCQKNEQFLKPSFPGFTISSLTTQPQQGISQSFSRFYTQVIELTSWIWTYVIPAQEEVSQLKEATKEWTEEKVCQCQSLFHTKFEITTSEVSQIHDHSTQSTTI